MDTDDGDILSESAVCNEIDDMLDEAMDDSVEEEDAGPTPPKFSKIFSSSSGGDSPQRRHTKSSWEFHTPRGVTSTKNRNEEKFKTPKIVTSDSPVSRSPVCSWRERKVPSYTLFLSSGSRSPRPSP